METILYHPLSDLGRIKEKILSILSNTESVTKLIEGFYDISYKPETTVNTDYAVFVDTYITKSENARMKEVAVDFTVVCKEDSLTLSEEDRLYYHSLGIYGNRIDCTLQLIHSIITESQELNPLKKDICIGNITLLPENPVQKCDTMKGFYGKQMHYTYQSFISSKEGKRQVIL